MKTRVKLFEVPFIKHEAFFDVEVLTLRIQGFFAQLKILIPSIDALSCDLEHEMLLVNEHVLLIVYLIKQPQLTLSNISNVSLNEAKIKIVAQVKMLPAELNLLSLETYSIGQYRDLEQDDSEEKIRQLIKKNQKDTIRFLLDDEEVSLGFPEMAPYVTDRTCRTIKFIIDYIHCDYFKIKLLSDSIDGGRYKKMTYLKVGTRIFDDGFFFESADAMRSKPKKLITKEAYCFRDSVTNDILMYHIL